jgi:hypothetical protein
VNISSDRSHNSRVTMHLPVQTNIYVPNSSTSYLVFLPPPQIPSQLDFKMRLLPLLPLALLAQAHSLPCINKTDTTRDAIMEIITSPYADEVDLLAARSLHKLSEWQRKYDGNNTCTIENAVRRREWCVPLKSIR